MAGTSVVLPILKFSYTTTSAERTSPLGWTHLSGGADLAVVFDHVTGVDERSGQSKEMRHLKVQRGMEILEEVNLTWLAQEARAGSSQMNSQATRSSVALLVKSPCVAIRYPTRMNQVRRFQVKFSTEPDYYKAIAILSEIGCPITDSVPSAAPPPSSHQPRRSGQQGIMQANSTSSATPDASSVRPSSAMTDVRPSTVASSSTVSAAPAQAPGQWTNGPISLPHHPAQHQNTFQRPEQPPTLASKDRPSTAPSFPDLESLSQLLPPKRELPFGKKGRQSASNTTGNENVNAATSRGPLTPARTSTITSTPRIGLRDQTSTTIIPSSQPVQNTQMQHSAAVYNPANTRPPQPPIPDPFVSSSSNDNQNRRHLSEVPNTLLNRINQLPSSSGPPRRLFDPDPQVAGIHDPFTTSTQAQATTYRPSAFINQLTSAPSPPPTAAGYPPTTTTTTASTSASTVPAITPHAPLALQQNPIPPSTPLPAPRARPEPQVSTSACVLEPSASDLSSYLTTPHAERTAQLESWICAQLENEGFLALCADVESVWRRVAYGV